MQLSSSREPPIRTLPGFELKKKKKDFVIRWSNDPKEISSVQIVLIKKKRSYNSESLKVFINHLKGRRWWTPVWIRGLQKEN